MGGLVDLDIRPSGPVATSVGDELAVDHVGSRRFEAAQAFAKRRTELLLGLIDVDAASVACRK